MTHICFQKVISHNVSERDSKMNIYWCCINQPLLSGFNSFALKSTSSRVFFWRKKNSEQLCPKAHNTVLLTSGTTACIKKELDNPCENPRFLKHLFFFPEVCLMHKLYRKNWTNHLMMTMLPPISFSPSYSVAPC